jgi:glycosyltransferase involved in cell wall biosynthesis
MRVLQVTPRYLPNLGGVETVVQKVSEALAASGNEVIVYTIDLDGNLPPSQKLNGVFVKRFGPKVGDPLFLPEPGFITSLRREKADIIHCHNSHTLPLLIGAVCKQRSQKLVLQPYYHRFGQSVFRHSLLKSYGILLDTLAFPRADLVLSNSEYEKRVLMQDFKVRENTLLTLPLGVDTAELGAVRRCPIEPKRILYVGALKSYKNIDKLIRGFARLIDVEGKDYRLVIVGRGPEQDALIRLARNLRVSSYVEWKHDLSREELLVEYSKASIFVMLSNLESFSLVVYEALVIGVPVVVLNYGPLATLVQRGLVEGVDSLDALSIKNALVEAVSRCARMPDQTDLFLDWKSYTARVNTLYQKLLN